jgi:hypothetical protein
MGSESQLPQLEQERIDHLLQQRECTFCPHILIRVDMIESFPSPHNPTFVNAALILECARFQDGIAE